MNDKLILTLVEKFDASSIAELDLNDGTSRLVLRKDAAFAHGQAAGVYGPSSISGAAQTGAVSGAASAGGEVPPVHLGLPVLPGSTAVSPTVTGGELITSPIVATFYASSGPDAPPFVKAGSRVKAGASLCILEAMKMMNHLEAEFDCEILSVKAASGDLVEYGQALFEVKRL
ncbi:MAG: acetyl-CoA carboxylase biotin carboxyl carrier protein [Treponema sp.]|jgi:acetyl-CoA carboxylase biotin carboxyl carrier protein|nr:acetyl-CoA carboxylase biotin carboxyl carrier protein [Treponema sp.]